MSLDARFKIGCIIIAVLLQGCATIGQPQFHVAVDSLASPAAQHHKTYILLPGNDGVTWDDLQFQEYAVYAMRALERQGFIPAESADDADVAVVMSYGIGDPVTRDYTYSLPVWGQTGVSSAQTYGTATSFGNTATYSSSTTYTPRYGITGYRTQTGSVTTYFRYALLTGYDFSEFRDSGRQVELWRTTVTSNGESGDLRRVFPVLMGAAAPYISSSTAQRVVTSLSESDDAVEAIRGRMSK